MSDPQSLPDRLAKALYEAELPGEWDSISDRTVTDALVPAVLAALTVDDELVDRCAEVLCRHYLAELLHLPGGLPGVQYAEITEEGREVYRRVVRAVLTEAHR